MQDIIYYALQYAKEIKMSIEQTIKVAIDTVANVKNAMQRIIYSDCEPYSEQQNQRFQEMTGHGITGCEIAVYTIYDTFCRFSCAKKITSDVIDKISAHDIAVEQAKNLYQISETVKNFIKSNSKDAMKQSKVYDAQSKAWDLDQK